MGLSTELGNLQRYREDSGSLNENKDSSLKEWQSQPYVFEKEKSWKAIDLSEPIEAKPSLELAEKKTADAEHRTAMEGSFKSLSARRQPWAVQLAKQEARMDKDQTVDFDNSFRKADLLKQKTAEFICELQKLFREQSEIFNNARSSKAQQIHIYKVSRTDHDFMLFRNGVKLVISAQQSGRILFAFNQYLGELFAPGRKPVFELQAQWGVLDQLYWSYKSERLEQDDLLRFFFTEFIRQSYR